jgi:gamma-glutamyltranspeptidase / glutathione hydrolase / leukotriene-C4 hydrolase
MTIRIPPSDAHSEPQVYTINFRETAPAGAHKDMYVKNPTLSQFGGLASGVPGEVLGLEKAYNISHKLPWKKLVEPSIALAKGWEVDKELAKRMHVRAHSTDD